MRRSYCCLKSESKKEALGSLTLKSSVAGKNNEADKALND